MSGRRTVVELSILLAGLVLVVWLVVRGAGVVAAFLTPHLSPELDISIGRALSQQQRFLGQRCDNPELASYIATITKPLVSRLSGSPFRYEFSVVGDPQVNAFALPGGFITINFGLIEKAKSGEEIAAVVAHELQHVELRHSTRTILRQVSGWSAVGIVFGDTSFQVPAYLLGNVEILRVSREQEAEADRLGLELLVAAGIRPNGMASFFKRLADEPLQVPEFFSTHPDPGNRVVTAEQFAHGHKNFPQLAEPRGLRCHK